MLHRVHNDNNYDFLIGSDFVATSETISFTTGETTQTIEVFISDDNILEGSEEFYVTLTTTDSDVVIFQPNATINIVEDG